MFYNQDLTIAYQLMLTMSTQILGYAFAGITRRYLVRPPSMIWPATLMSTAMFATMHKRENKTANGWKISRWRFFILVWMSAFAWYFMPGLIMPALSYFNILTWFAPDSVVMANLVSALLRKAFCLHTDDESSASHLVLVCFPSRSIGPKSHTLGPPCSPRGGPQQTLWEG